jgi:hypothetical protein
VPNPNPDRHYPWGDTLNIQSAFMEINGRPQYWNPIANYLFSQDPWEVGPTPVGFYADSPVEKVIDDVLYTFFPLPNRSPHDIFDLCGNVWEWVGDWYQEDYYAEAPYKNPFGPDMGTAKVIRGGSWKDEMNNLRNSKRSFIPPNYTEDFVGFRLARSRKK